MICTFSSVGCVTVLFAFNLKDYCCSVKNLLTFLKSHKPRTESHKPRIESHKPRIELYKPRIESQKFLE